MPCVKSHQYKKINRSLALESLPNQVVKKYDSHNVLLADTNFKRVFSGFFFLVATTLTLTPSASATHMNSRSSEIFAAATTDNPGSSTSEDGQHMATSVVSSSSINTDTGIPVSSRPLRRDETTAFEVETIMATSTSTSSSVRAATHNELNSEISLNTENSLNSAANPVSKRSKFNR